MKKSILTVLMFGVILMTGCSMEMKMSINKDLSSVSELDLYTTEKEEQAILKSVGSSEGLGGDVTYADLMESMEFKFAGTKKVDGEKNNIYTMSQPATAEETKNSFIELTGKKAVMNIAENTESQTEIGATTSSTDLSEMGFCYMTIKYPFKVAKTNGKLKADGYTVTYDVLKLQKKKTDRIYALSASALADSKTVTIKGVTNKKAYKKPVKVKATTKGVITSFTVNGKAQDVNSYYAKKDGKYKVVVKTAAGKKKVVTFYVDSKKPTTNVKNNKTYKKAIKIIFKDGVSGIKKATLNGKKISSGKKVAKNGTYILKITDKAGNVKKVKFKIKK